MCRLCGKMVAGRWALFLCALRCCAASLLQYRHLPRRYMEELSGTQALDYQSFPTRGSISVHINANRLARAGGGGG